MWYAQSFAVRQSILPIGQSYEELNKKIYMFLIPLIESFTV